MAMSRASVDAKEAIRTRAFGIDIESTFPIPCLQAGSANGSARTHVELIPAHELDSQWKPRNTVMVIDRRVTDGRRLMTIEHDAELGFRIWARRFGRHI